MAQNSYQQLFMDLDGDFAPENIFDLRAEYADVAVQLGRMAQERNCILALSIAPYTPRFFLGEPQPLREIIFSLVESSLHDVNVDIVNVRIGSVGTALHGRHRLEILVASNGTALPPRQMTLFDLAPKISHRKNSYVELRNRQRIYQINKLLGPLNGTLRIEDVYGRGPRYIARFHLTRVSSGSTS